MVAREQTGWREDPKTGHRGCLKGKEAAVSQGREREDQWCCGTADKSLGDFCLHSLSNGSLLITTNTTKH